MTRTKPSRKTVRCAIYTRQSTEEGLDQDFNSLDAQREAGEAFIKSQAHEGWECVPDHYDDGGYSGGNMERPALQDLMVQIEAKKVDCVVVYKVDRLSRSLMDFARMMEVFERHQIAFVSVTQQFNTASSMGRLVLNVLLSFAQFEREMISERTRDKIAATRRKGKWSGGMPVLGYDVADRKLVINELEAKLVRRIFAQYIERKSLLAVVQQLEREGCTGKSWTTRKGVERGGQPFTKTSLHQLIRNVLYKGQIRYKTEVFAGEHQSIIEPQIFDEVQILLSSNGRHAAKAPEKYTAVLAGLLKCDLCDRAMAPSYTSRGRNRYRYYVCTGAQKRGWHVCPSASVPAGEIERFVISELRSIADDPDSLAAALAAPSDDSSEEITFDAPRVFDGLRKVLDAWESLASWKQANLLKKILKQVSYNAKLGQVGLTLCTETIEQIAMQTAAIGEKDICQS